MTEVVLQGIATHFGKIIDDGTKLIYMEPDCMTLSDTVELLIDHKGNSIATTDDALEIHVDEKFLAFRFSIPESWTKQFNDNADDFNTYLPVSVGMTITESKTMTINGVRVEVISAATLNEVSLISGEPAVKTTYARVVSADICNDLEDDCERMELIGRYISLHRKATASENDGLIKYAHASSAYDRASDRFTRALRNLA